MLPDMRAVISSTDVISFSSGALRTMMVEPRMQSAQPICGSQGEDEKLRTRAQWGLSCREEGASCARLALPFIRSFSFSSHEASTALWVQRAGARKGVWTSAGSCKGQERSRERQRLARQPQSPEREQGSLNSQSVSQALQAGAAAQAAHCADGASRPSPRKCGVSTAATHDMSTLRAPRGVTRIAGA